MIAVVDENRLQDFYTACAIERVFGSKARAAWQMGGNAGEPRFWVGYAENTPSAAVYRSGEVLIISSDNRLDPRELAALAKETGVTEIDTNFDQSSALQKLLGGRIESSFYMAYGGGRHEPDFGGIRAQADLRAVFSVLQQSHEYYRAHLTFEPWAAELSRKLELGLMELVQLDVDGMPVGTGSIVSEDDKVGAIAAVAVIPAFRGQGLGSKISKYLVNRILDKGKQPVLISGYDEVAALYRKIGFDETGRWGELYL